MKNNLMLFIISFLSPAFLQSCGKEGEGMPEAQGGDLPTNYIILKDSAFSPASITAVNGNTFTFVNFSGKTAGIYSSDSILINKQGIAPNTSYIFKRDSVITSAYTINYHLAGKPQVAGSITITP